MSIKQVQDESYVPVFPLTPPNFHESHTEALQITRCTSPINPALNNKYQAYITNVQPSKHRRHLHIHDFMLWPQDSKVQVLTMLQNNVFTLESLCQSF